MENLLSALKEDMFSSKDLLNALSPAARAFVQAQLCRGLQGGLIALEPPKDVAPSIAHSGAGIPRMNQWESEYAGILSIRKIAGEVLWFEFEPFRLRIGRGAWYTPDFAILNSDGRLGFIEVKGFWRESAKVRIKVAAEKYPFEFVVARKVDGQWVHEKV